MDIDKYENSNPLIAKILQAKRERLSILQELNKQYEEELPPLEETSIAGVAKKKTPRRKREIEETPSPGIIRRSLRLSSSNITPSYRYEDDWKDYRDYRPSAKTKRIRPPNDYGPMSGIEVGHHWETRMECSYDGVHRPTVAGIHAGEEGAYSIALSGGYPEDVDEGDTFTYTGAGGRDLKGTKTNPKNLRTAPQTKDQQLEGVNYSLVRSIETGMPIRVIRGYKSPSVFAPESGYRYDGLYKVVRYWEDVGKTGFRVFRFEMVRIDESPPPWEMERKHRGKENAKDRVPSEIDDSSRDSDQEDLQEKEIPPRLGLPGGSSDASSHKFILRVSASSEFDSSTDADCPTDADDIDVEIDLCRDRLCQKSLPPSFLVENDSEDLDFLGWD